jgi:hypothetical protein
MGKERKVLKNDAAVPFIGRDIVDPLSADEYIALIRTLKSADYSHGSGFAATAGTQNGKEFSPYNLQTDIVYRDNIAKSFIDIA